MNELNPIWLVSGGFIAAWCLFATMADWFRRRSFAIDARSIHVMADDECADWVLERYGYLVDGCDSLTLSQKLEVIRRKLEFEAEENEFLQICKISSAILTVGMVVCVLL
jgi:hypothetical protein